MHCENRFKEEEVLNKIAVHGCNCSISTCNAPSRINGRGNLPNSVCKEGNKGRIGICLHKKYIQGCSIATNHVKDKVITTLSNINNQLVHATDEAHILARQSKNSLKRADETAVKTVVER